jgi:hypothetical protein
MADAAAILSRRWVLQVTNVPFLGRGRQEEALKTYLMERFDAAKADLATAMLTRMRAQAAQGGTVAAVTPQNWLFLGSYQMLRKAMLKEASLAVIGALGPRCFETISGEVVNAALVVITEIRPTANTRFAGLDCNDGADPSAKARTLLSGEIAKPLQQAQYERQDFRISVSEPSLVPALSQFADVFVGFQNGDTPRWIACFWELPSGAEGWSVFHATPERTGDYEGLDAIIRWEEGQGELARSDQARVQGREAWGRDGVLCRQTQPFPTSLYMGTLYDQSGSVVVPRDPSHLAAIRAFLESEDFRSAMLSIASAMKFTNSTFVKVPFDLSHWQGIAAERYLIGLPAPYSNDPTQWLFHGHPRYASSGTELHVALARLAGYRWPAETDTAMRLSAEARARIAEAATLSPADADGLLPLSPLLGERGLADRLRAWCAAAWGEAWSSDTEAALITATCARANDRPPRSLTLEAWLRTHAARQHAKLFHARPFLWWITDGRADGFCAVAHYHRLTKDKLERLAFQMVGDHLTRLGDDPRAEAGKILQRKLERIIEGEAPFDIFVRWKPLHAQPLGWDPDLDDGVRLNIRPFIEAGVLAHVPNVKYGVDRGKDVPSAPWYSVFSGERRNDHHTTLAEKRAARANQGSQR